ncbi:hypothetical protein [Cohnella sp.]|uniref:hypothetical protein n=1 Tax=Cohnella sp. TaxID=1883426 RepID=UPI00356B4F0B
MKSFKMGIACLVAVLFLSAVLAGCSGNGGKTESADPSSTQGTAPNGSGTAAEPLMEITILDALNAAVKPGADNPNDIVTPEVEKKFNIKIAEITPSGGKMPAELINMMVAAGNVPDIVFTDNQNIGNFYAKDAFADLTEYKDHLVNMKKWYSDVAWKMLESDGKLIALPSGGDPNMDNPELASRLNEDLLYRPMNNFAIQVREDVLRKAGYTFKSVGDLQQELDGSPRRVTSEDLQIEPAIDTFEDFEALLYKIKDLNLTANGKPVYPLYVPGEYGPHILSVIYAPTSGFWHDKDADRASAFLENPNVKEFYKVMNKWIKDGIIDKDFMIDKADQMQTKIAGGNAAVIITTSDINAARTAVKRSNPEDDFRPIPWPASRSGKTAYVDPSYPAGSANIMINKNFNDIPRLLKYLDWFYSDEAMELGTWGPESAGLWEVKDGKKVFKDNALWEAISTGTTTADGKGASYYGLLDYFAPVEWTSKAFAYAPTPPYNLQNYRLSYPIKLNAYADMQNFISSKMLARDGSMLPAKGEAASTLAGYYWSSTVKKLPIAMMAKTDAEFDKEWQAIADDMKSNGRYDEAMQQMLQEFRAINGK